MAADTRDRILAAATRLYAEADAGGPALRAIAREGGVNSALIHYHFGSREGLLEAVLLRSLEPTQARRAPLIETLRSEGSADGLDLARLCVVLSTALPSLSAETKQRRFGLAAETAVTSLAGHAATLARSEGNAAFDVFARDLTTFLAGALEAAE